MPPRLQLHLKLGNRQGPSAEGLREPAFQVKEPQQSACVFRDRKFPAQRPVVARKAVAKCLAPLGGGLLRFRLENGRNLLCG